MKVYGKSCCENVPALLELSSESSGKVCFLMSHGGEIGKESKNHKNKLQSLKAGGILHRSIHRCCRNVFPQLRGSSKAV